MSIFFILPQNPQTHRALEGGPTNGLKKDEGRGQCDALFLDNDVPIGVLEVEGTRVEPTIKKIGTFFKKSYEEISSLQWGILLIYAYSPVVKDGKKTFKLVASAGTLENVQRTSKNYSDKPFIVITIEKQFNIDIKRGIRHKSPYYMGEPCMIETRLYEAGLEVDRKVISKR